MLKVLHTGDLHLGMAHKSRNYPEFVRLQLVEARFLALDKLIAAANHHGCQLFVIAGDLFHSEYVQKSTLSRALQSLKMFAGACVAILPGNHDYYSEQSQVWKYFKEQASDQIILLSETRPYDLQEYGLDAVLYPAPCNHRHSPHNRLGWIRELGSRLPRRWQLGVAHGSVRGLSPDFDSRYFPMEKDELLQLKMDHIFLGHTHVRYPDADSAINCGFAYCGTPEPDGFDCSHQGSAWLVMLDDQQKTEQKSIPAGSYRFRELQIFVDNLQLMTDALTEAADDHVLIKLKLAGRLAEDEYIRRTAVLQELAGRMLYLEYDDSMLKMEINQKMIAAEFPAGSFPQLFLNALAEGGDNEALQLGYELVRKVKKC